jgi:hypothetical protein
MHVFSPAELVVHRLPAAQDAIAVVVATQERVLPAETEQSDVWTVFVVLQRRVPVVVDRVLVVEELELVVEEVVEVVEDAVLALVEAVVESEVVESVVVDAAALEGAAVLEAAADDSVVFAVVLADAEVFLSLVFSVADFELESVESALLLNSRSSSSRTAARYSCANHVAATVASAFEHAPAI